MKRKIFIASILLCTSLFSQESNVASLVDIKASVYHLIKDNLSLQDKILKSNQKIEELANQLKSNSATVNESGVILLDNKDQLAQIRLENQQLIATLFEQKMTNLNKIIQNQSKELKELQKNKELVKVNNAVGPSSSTEEDEIIKKYLNNRIGK